MPFFPFAAAKLNGFFGSAKKEPIFFKKYFPRLLLLISRGFRRIGDTVS
jgi:hypothetical protein